MTEAKVNEHSQTAIRIGDYYLYRGASGCLWIENDIGEGMGLGEESEKKLAELIDAFFKEYY